MQGPHVMFPYLEAAMRRHVIASVAVVGSLILGACSGRETTAPRGIAPDQANAAGGPNATCSNTYFNNLVTLADAYFTAGSKSKTPDAVYGYLSQMATDYKNGLYSAATTDGWQVMSRVADARLTDATNDGVYGAPFVNGVFTCMQDSRTNKPIVVPTDFSDNTALILNSGVWEVRTGGATGGPALGKVQEDTTVHVRVFGQPRWGVEALTTATNWPGPAGFQYAVYGYPELVGNPLTTAATTIDTNDGRLSAYISQHIAPFTGFELGSVPYDLPRTGLRVGVCTSSNPTANDGVFGRLIHYVANTQIFGNDPPTQMCSSTLTASAPVPATWYANYLNRVWSVFAPANLYAFVDDCTDCMDWPSTGWSPFEPGSMTASNITFKITVQPKNTSISKLDSMTVQTLYNGTLPLSQIPIDSITVSNNSGVPAGAVITFTSVPQSTQEPDGTAKIYFRVGKAGGYLITVWASADGVVLPPVTSVLFNVKNQ